MELITDVRNQLQAEIGNDELTKEETKMLEQKYGIIPPQFTASERNLILREERKANGYNSRGK